jgi:hypothetical protein
MILATVLGHTEDGGSKLSDTSVLKTGTLSRNDVGLRQRNAMANKKNKYKIFIL